MWIIGNGEILELESDELGVLNPGDTSASTSRSLRCAFIHAPNPVHADTQQFGAKFMPTWAYTLAAHIPEAEDHRLSLFDIRFDPLEQIPAQDIFLFSGMNQDHGNLLRVMKDLRGRWPDAVFVIGGPICWSFDQAGDLEKLGGFDSVVIGDGEQVISMLLNLVVKGETLPLVVRSDRRFPISQARPMQQDLLAKTIDRYYGAILEVSRGCPFLCEFCDIRIMPDNNRSHNKSPDLIIDELDQLANLGMTQVLLVCDNFIGEPRWAEEVVDKIIAWRQRTGYKISFFSWLTINLYKLPRLMEKMRLAGFDLLFIGIESFTQNSLLETAKVQNSSIELVEAVSEVQSYGFIVVAGLIFGFDADDDESFDLTLQGLRESGLLSGDPSLLTALPGTPLYRRMKLSGRLREMHGSLGGYKYQTNIKYLLSRRTMIDGYRRFVHAYDDGAYQFQRLRRYMALLDRGNFIPLDGVGYGDLRRVLRMILLNPAASWQLLQRLWRFGRNPLRLIYALRGFLLVLSKRNKVSNALNYFNFWLFAWSNSVLRYHDLSDDDFDIESVEANFDLKLILPADYENSADEAIPAQKTKAQLRSTTRALGQVIAEKTTPSTL
jgi:radical SAM superfamily enzyme YgiQ (UPF0313 family)